MIDIIEDCSPYYVRFRFDNIQKVIDYALSVTPENVTQHYGYSHEFFSQRDANHLFSLLPVLRINFKRASVFTTPPNGGCGIHKDGLDHKVSFNIMLQASEECVTTWYADELFDGKEVHTHEGYTRNVYHDWRSMDKFVPLKSFVAQPNEMVMFNTDIYHAWSNKSNSVTRKNLLLRSGTPGMLNFYQVKKLLGV